MVDREHHHWENCMSIMHGYDVLYYTPLRWLLFMMFNLLTRFYHIINANVIRMKVHVYRNHCRKCGMNKKKKVNGILLMKQLLWKKNLSITSNQNDFFQLNFIAKVHTNLILKLRISFASARFTATLLKSLKFYIKTNGCFCCAFLMATSMTVIIHCSYLIVLSF